MTAESKGHPHVPEEQAHLFTAPEWVGGMEKEYADLVFALVRATKPLRVLETGTGHGHTSCEIVRALILNGNEGRLVTVEMDEACIEASHARLNTFQNARKYYTIVQGRALEYIEDTGEVFDFALIDSDLAERGSEIEALLIKLRSRAIVIVHDTSRLRTTQDGSIDISTPIFWRKLHQLQKEVGLQITEFPLSRGLVILQAP